MFCALITTIRIVAVCYTACKLLDGAEIVYDDWIKPKKKKSKKKKSKKKKSKKRR